MIIMLIIYGVASVLILQILVHAKRHTDVNIQCVKLVFFCVCVLRGTVNSHMSVWYATPTSQPASQPVSKPASQHQRCANPNRWVKCYDAWIIMAFRFCSSHMERYISWMEKGWRRWCVCCYVCAALERSWKNIVNVNRSFSSYVSFASRLPELPLSLLWLFIQNKGLHSALSLCLSLSPSQFIAIALMFINKITSARGLVNIYKTGGESMPTHMSAVHIDDLLSDLC